MSAVPTVVAGRAHRGPVWATSAQVAQVTIVTSYDSATTLQVIILSREAIPRSYTHAKMAILPKRYDLDDPRLHQPYCVYIVRYVKRAPLRRSMAVRVPMRLFYMFRTIGTFSYCFE